MGDLTMIADLLRRPLAWWRSIDGNVTVLEDHLADVIAQRDTAVRQRHQTKLQLQSAAAEVERCRRHHSGLAQRNSTLQTTNVRLAAQLEHIEHTKAVAHDNAEYLGRLVAVYRQQLLDNGIPPRVLDAADVVEGDPS
jgi:chromosome segregation ATPase